VCGSDSMGQFELKFARLSVSCSHKRILKEMINVFIMDKYCYNGVFFINDIVAEDKQFLS
jgi:hypothetical protein